MAFLFFIIAFLLFIYKALAPVFDYVINGDFDVIAWGLAFFVLGHIVHTYVPGGYFGLGRGRRHDIV